MSANKRRYREPRDLFLSAPGFATYHEIGVLFQSRLPRFAPLPEVAEYLGTTRQAAYHVSVVALGKLIYHLARAVGERPQT